MSARETPLPPPGELERSLRRPRAAFSAFMNLLITAMTISALLPLFAVLVMLLLKGAKRLSVEVFTQLPPSAMAEGGGFGNAIVGTFLMVSLAAAISVPIGVLGALYLAEVGPETRLANVVRFAAKVLTGFPSILAGVFAYGAVVILMGGFNALAGAVALSILMLPTIILTSEEAIRMVPSRMREAAIGMGCTLEQAVRMVLLPTAFPGILTGVMLAIARAAGETAPLLFTALFSNYWVLTKADVTGHGLGGAVHAVAHAPLEPIASLAVLIYNFSGVPFENQVEMAWAAALVLVLMVLVTNLAGQALGRRGAIGSAR